MRTTTGGQTANSKRQTTNALLLPRPHAALIRVRLHFANTNTNARLQREVSTGGRGGGEREGDVEALSATRARFVARGKRSSARCVAFLAATAADAVRFCLLMKAFSRWDKSPPPYPHCPLLPFNLSGTRVDWGNKCIAACGMQLAALTADLTFDSCIFHSWWHSFFYL